MKTHTAMGTSIATICLSGLFAMGTFHSLAVSSDAEDNQVLSRLQSMSQGMYCDAEWYEVVSQADAEIAGARAAEDWGRVVDITVVKARAHAMRNENDLALRLLLDVIGEYEDQDVPELSRAFVEAAQIYSKLGRQDDVSVLKRRYVNSSSYSEDSFGYSGGTGPGDPIVLERPHGKGSSSVSMTAMNLAEKKAGHQVGNTFPDFNVETLDGRSFSQSDARGQVVLVDFWLPGWSQWEADLPSRKSIYKRYKRKGFTIVGLSLIPDVDRTRNAAREFNMPWMVAVPERALLKELGIFGEVSNFLIDPNGVIIGRDLYGANLEAAVKKAVENY